jgi:cell division control protein 24
MVSSTSHSEQQQKIQLTLPPSLDSPTDPLTPHSKHSSNPLDPVTQTLEIFRLGSPLCFLYNAIHNPPLSVPDPTQLPPLPPGKTWSNLKPLKVLWCPRDDLKGCQKSAAHFIMALKTELGWGTEIDETKENGLMVNMLYDVNTNATVKVRPNTCTCTCTK